jgi:hypothetical protein
MTKNYNVVDLLCECAADAHGMARLRDALGVSAESGWQQQCLAEVADMVEAERDELKAKVAELVEKLGNFDGETYCGGTIVDWYEMAVRLQAQVEEMHETHMKLPVDADGVPIKPGDEIEYDDPLYENTRRCIVEAVCESSVFTDESYEAFTACDCRHAKPETLESLLQRLADEVWEASITCQTTWSDSGLDGIAELYAERIRKAVHEWRLETQLRNFANTQGW